MTGIYKITNKINGKMYVGQSIDIVDRWRQHEQNYRLGLSDFAIYRAFDKYGFENFEFSIIEETLPEHLSEREIYWIKTLHTYVKDPECNGYNMTIGGEGNALIDGQVVRDLWNQGLSVIEIADKTGHDRSAVRKYLIDCPDYDEYESRSRGNRTMWKNRGENVEQYTLSGEYINTFFNLADAERATGVSAKNIWNAVSGVSLAAGGYQWKYISDDRTISDIRKQTKIQKQSVIKINKDGTISKYESAAEASRQTGISATQIRKVCQGKGLTAGGYKWYYEEGSDFNEHQDNFS